jgi:hypothetical protein
MLTQVSLPGERRQWKRGLLQRRVHEGDMGCTLSSELCPHIPRTEVETPPAPHWVSSRNPAQKALLGPTEVSGPWERQRAVENRAEGRHISKEPQECVEQEMFPEKFNGLPRNPKHPTLKGVECYVYVGWSWELIRLLPPTELLATDQGQPPARGSTTMSSGWRGGGGEPRRISQAEPHWRPFGKDGSPGSSQPWVCRRPGSPSSCVCRPVQLGMARLWSPTLEGCFHLAPHQERKSCCQSHGVMCFISGPDL